MRNPHIGHMDVIHLMKGSCDSPSPATQVLVSVKFLWDTAAVERSGFWERRKNRTRFSFTNKTTTVLTLKENATWQFYAILLGPGVYFSKSKTDPQKSHQITVLLTSRNSRLHRHVCNWRGPLVVVTACHLVYQRHEHPQPQQGTQAVVGTIDLNGDVETHVSICKPTKIASCMCHLCFVDGCSLAPCGHRMCHIGHFFAKGAMINHHLHLNQKISQQKQWATRKALLTPWLNRHFCICQCFTFVGSPRLVRAMCCPVQSSDLKTHSFAKNALQNDCPFKLKKKYIYIYTYIIRIEFKDSEINDHVWCVKVLQAPWLQLFCIQTASISNGFHAIVYITRQHCFWVHSIGEKGLMELLMKRWCPNFPWKFWIIYNYIGRNPKQPPGMYEAL